MRRGSALPVGTQRQKTYYNIVTDTGGFVKKEEPFWVNVIQYKVECSNFSYLKVYRMILILTFSHRWCKIKTNKTYYFTKI